MAKTKSNPGGKSTRNNKSEPRVETKSGEAKVVEAKVNDRPTAIDNAPTTLDAEPIEKQVNPSVQVSASTSEPRPEATFEAPKFEGNGRADVSNKSDGVKMFEVRKTEARKNVIPINLEDEIRRRAYELFQQRGHSFGNEADDWLAAEREVMQRYHHQQSA